jgi:hypothetical protein
MSSLDVEQLSSLLRLEVLANGLLRHHWGEYIFGNPSWTQHRGETFIPTVSVLSPQEQGEEGVFGVTLE